MEAFESAGIWWLPDQPEQQTVGILRYKEDEGFKLEIPFGHLGSQEQFVERVNNPRAIPLVYGQLQNGKQATLVNLHCTNISLAMPGTGREEHLSMLGFIGKTHAPENPVVDKVRLQYAHLRDWAVIHPFASSHHEAEAANFSELEYRYKRLPERELVSADDFELVLGHTAKWPLPSVAGFTVSHDCYLELDLKSGLPFRQADEGYVTPIWRFLCFALDHLAVPTLLEVRLLDTDEWLTVGRASLQTVEDQNIIRESFMLLSLPRLGDRAGPVLSTWIGLAGDERRAISLLVGLSRKTDTPADLKFLAAAQALEAMSRVDAEETELSEAEFQRRVKAVAEALAGKLRKWAAWKLKYCNWRSASALTEDLLEFIGLYADTLIPDRERFLADLRDNRNFYTHRDDRRAGRVFDGAELYWLTQAVVCLLKAAVLRRLGFDQNETATLMAECQGTLQNQAHIAKMYALESSEEA